ncbi:MAG: alcohol dehydrogenase catalytic domain-containing protein [Acidobacteriota bacterium]|nr:alcohol dehydrogenase catalytic domain-containing protein [Acidobacteriota bacterium]MDE3168592.1 alcohol dehydrogenase catalytic domain-containing protein [Acidobacteriota bacterium]
MHTVAQVDSQQTARAPKRMRAGVYRGESRVVVEEVPVPEIGPGEILFRVAACGICGTDIKKIQHGFVKPPQILGHELAGTVVEVGAGVTKFKTGDRVVSFHHIPCGNCFYCQHKLFSQCSGYKKTGLTAGFDPSGGGFAQYVRAMPWIVERGMLALPPDVSFDEATFVEPVNTSLKAVRKARVAPGETVLVIGQGPIGMLVGMIATLEGARVYTSDPLELRRAASVRFGAVESFDPRAINLSGEMRGRTGGRGADAVILAAPNPPLVAEALAISRPGGRVLLFAHNDPVLQLQFPAAAIGVEEREILGSYSASVDDQAESAALVFERRLPVRDTVSHRFPLERIAEALDLAAHPKGDTLKILIIHE